MRDGRSPSSDVGIHQILVVASPGDAITNVAIALRDLLRNIGPSEIYARHVDPRLEQDVLPLENYVTHHVRNVLIFHASMGQPEVHEFLLTRRETLVLWYHNITPPEYFEPYDVVFAELLAAGRRELNALRSRVALTIADSAYNARELEAIGYRNVRVIPPMMGSRHLENVEPRASTVDHLATFDAPIFLSVGQLLPHKRPDFLIETMHISETYLHLADFLMLVGHQRIPRYTRAVRDQIRELNMLRVHVVGSVDDADLAAMYHMASVVVSASDHEGFCLPLVEAMRFGKPIVARACAAIPETVDGAAVLLPDYAGPEMYAEALLELSAQPSLGEQLTARASVRIAELDSAADDSVVLGALLGVV
jgi:glycosyltransferase involved in cell wall biosynthesis